MPTAVTADAAVVTQADGILADRDKTICLVSAVSFLAHSRSAAK
jgi:hypothetical protein